MSKVTLQVDDYRFYCSYDDYECGAEWESISHIAVGPIDDEDELHWFVERRIQKGSSKSEQVSKKRI